ncbi:MAG: hypothetical protein ACJ8LL_10765 [Candidatus Udaeobacter sp.]
MENAAKEKGAVPADSAREAGANAATVSARVARPKLLEIGLDKAAALPAAVAAGDRVAPYPNLRLEQVHEKQAHTRPRKRGKHAAPGWHVSARAMAMQIEVANRAKRERSRV